MKMVHLHLYKHNFFYSSYSPGALTTGTVWAWKKNSESWFFSGMVLWHLLSRNALNPPKIAVVLNAWECQIQDGRHFANYENLTVANVIFDRVTNRWAGGSKMYCSGRLLWGHDNILYWNVGKFIAKNVHQWWSIIVSFNTKISAWNKR